MSSASLRHPDHWWYRARAPLLETVLARFVPPGVVIDIGSADGPSVRWLRAIPLDIDLSALRRGVQANAARLPFADGSIDALCAFDVIEHVEDDRGLVTEFRRVLRPGGLLLLAVPAYQWAWTAYDERAGHFRRYSRGSLVGLVRSAGYTVQRVTYAFCGTFPLFLLARLTGSGGVREISRWQDRLLMGLSSIDRALLSRMNLPFGSSVFMAARAPQDAA